VNVQNRVALATPLLPQEVVRAGVTTKKTQSSNLLIFSLYSNNPDYDQTFVQNYADINLIPLIKRVPGVGDVSAFGSRVYSIISEAQTFIIYCTLPPFMQKLTKILSYFHEMIADVSGILTAKIKEENEFSN
jgi:Cu/Ag efflux pump CusA